MIRAMLIGVVGTSVIHLSKGVMKLGITLGGNREGDHAGSRTTGSRTAGSRTAGSRTTGSRARTVWFLGVLMNFTNPLWVILANRFAPTIYYTSMYGLGLIALLLFSKVVLGEAVGRRQALGVAVIVVGTLVIGLTELGQDPPSLYSAIRPRVIMVAGLWLVGAPLAAALVRRYRLGVQELVFGVAAGGLAALEAVVKGVAQAGAVENTFLPQTGENWVFFILSFIGAAGAFGMIQWSFLRQCRASIMGAAYTVSYVAVPLLVVPFLLGTTAVSVGCLLGIAILAGGVFLVATTGAAPQPTAAASS